MLKRVLVFGGLFLVGILYFDHKGWVQITPDGKRIAIVVVHKVKGLTKTLFRVARDVVNESEASSESR